MLSALRGLPLLVLVALVGAASMMMPAIHASMVDDHETARVFFYFSLLFLFLTSMAGIASIGRKAKRPARNHLIALVATFTVLPVVLAVPFYEAVGDTSFSNAYFEMVSSLTTTGATLYPPDRLPPSVHLWRAEVAWLGGLFIWVTAIAILAPMNLGGFEVRGMKAEIGQGASGETTITRVADTSERLLRFTLQFVPIYGFLTLVLWFLLFLAGDTPLVALCHAMSVLSTSGISPIGGVEESAAGVPGEAIMALFMVFALSRLTFAADERNAGARSLWYDPELRLGALLVLSLPFLMVVRHWIGAIEFEVENDLVAFLETLWGAAFTTMSFLTTTGFVSENWSTAHGWSGLQSPGLILMGLALFGGGVATTAGGVKLLRVYALYKHGMREMERLSHPNSVGGSGPVARQIRRQGALVAWVFFMLFALSIAAFMTGFAALGQTFETSLTLTLAGLTTTGPLLEVVGSEPVALAQIGETSRYLLAAAMVVGRLETLAIIALLNPDFWRT